MPFPNNMRNIIEQKYGTTMDEAMPRIIAEYRTPFKIAAHLGVYPYAVRNYMKRKGYQKIDGAWRLPDEVQHEPN